MTQINDKKTENKIELVNGSTINNLGSFIPQEILDHKGFIPIMNSISGINCIDDGYGNIKIEVTNQIGDMSIKVTNGEIIVEKVNMDYKNQTSLYENTKIHLGSDGELIKFSSTGSGYPIPQEDKSKFDQKDKSISIGIWNYMEAEKEMGAIMKSNYIEGKQITWEEPLKACYCAFALYAPREERMKGTINYLNRDYIDYVETTTFRYPNFMGLVTHSSKKGNGERSEELYPLHVERPEDVKKMNYRSYEQFIKNGELNPNLTNFVPNKEEFVTLKYDVGGLIHNPILYNYSKKMEILNSIAEAQNPEAFEALYNERKSISRT